MTEMLRNQTLSYDAGNATCIGYLALPAGEGPFPGVLVAPAFRGLSAFERGYCDKLAAMGYAALGVDYYSGGVEAADAEQATALKQVLEDDRPLLAARMLGALSTFRARPEVDETRIAAMGFCLGGKAVLDLARTGADFAAAAAFHGIFDAPPQGTQPMRAAVLALHGWDDPLAPPASVTALAAELSEACTDWQILALGGTGHAFTNPAAGGVAGFGYSERASARAWAAFTRLLDEKLG